MEAPTPRLDARLVLAVALVVTLGSGTSGADLTVNLVARPNPSQAGTWVDLEATIRNSGSEPAHRVKAGLELAGDRVVRADLVGECSAVGSMRLERGGATAVEPWDVSCLEERLDPGATSTVRLTSRTDAVGLSAARLEAGSLEIDLRPADNVAEVQLVSR